MRLIHTSDWHLGRSFHREDLLGAQASFLDFLAETAEVAGEEAGSELDRRWRHSVMTLTFFMLFVGEGRVCFFTLSEAVQASTRRTGCRTWALTPRRRGSSVSGKRCEWGVRHPLASDSRL